MCSLFRTVSNALPAVANTLSTFRTYFCIMIGFMARAMGISLTNAIECAARALLDTRRRGASMSSKDAA